MSDRVAPTPVPALPRAGQVAYFVHLHLDTARDDGAHPVLHNERVYRVDGKARPMLVLTELKPERGRRWLLAVPITSKGIDAKGNLKPDHIRMDRCLSADMESFAMLPPQRLPDNLLCGTAMRAADPFAFQNAVKVIERMKLGYDTKARQACSPSTD